MITSLTQKRGLEHRIHTLLEDRVIVETKTTTKATRYEVPLDNIRFDLQYQSDNKKGTAIALAILLLLPTLLTILFATSDKVKDSTTFLAYLWGCVAFLFLLKLINRPQDDIFLTGGKNHLILFRTAPNEVAVMTFITQVHEAIRAYLKDKHLSTMYGSDSDYQQLVQWLLSEKVISPVEAERYRERLHLQSMERLFKPSLN